MQSELPIARDSNLLVGLEPADDAAIYQITDDIAIIETVDFFPPIVDDPFSFGEIAMANAVSDIYAMGGQPILGLNIVGFPPDLPKSILIEILKGGASKAKEAGLIIAGGHTIQDEEPKYGLAITGIIKPGQQITTGGAKPGDKLVLTKPIGTGIITTAGKNQKAPHNILDAAIESMKKLNHAASDAMVLVGANACVDVTGFGLIGHLSKLALASKVKARLYLDTIQFLEGTIDLAKQGFISGGTKQNLYSANSLVNWDNNISQTEKLALCDAQTSGGLLISIPPDKINLLKHELNINGVETVAVIGDILTKNPKDDKLIDMKIKSDT